MIKLYKLRRFLSSLAPKAIAARYANRCLPSFIRVYSDLSGITIFAQCHPSWVGANPTAADLAMDISIGFQEAPDIHGDGEFRSHLCIVANNGSDLELFDGSFSGLLAAMAYLGQYTRPMKEITTAA